MNKSNFAKNCTRASHYVLSFLLLAAPVKSDADKRSGYIAGQSQNTLHEICKKYEIEDPDSCADSFVSDLETESIVKVFSVLNKIDANIRIKVVLEQEIARKAQQFLELCLATRNQKKSESFSESFIDQIRMNIIHSMKAHSQQHIVTDEIITGVDKGLSGLSLQYKQSVQTYETVLELKKTLVQLKGRSIQDFKKQDKNLAQLLDQLGLLLKFKNDWTVNPRQVTPKVIEERLSSQDAEFREHLICLLDNIDSKSKVKLLRKVR
jgi:hypothetical protein